MDHINSKNLNDAVIMSIDKLSAKPSYTPQAPVLNNINPVMTTAFPAVDYNCQFLVGTATSSVSINNTNGFFFVGYTDSLA